MSAPIFFNSDSTTYQPTSSTNSTKAATGITIPTGARTAVVGVLLDAGYPNHTVSSFVFNDGSNDLTPIVAPIPFAGRSSNAVRCFYQGVYDLTGVGTTSASVSCSHTGTSVNGQFFIFFTDGFYKSYETSGAYGDNYGFNSHSVASSSANETIASVFTMDALQSTNLDELSANEEVVIEGGALVSANVQVIGIQGKRERVGVQTEYTATNHTSATAVMSRTVYTFTSTPAGFLLKPIIN